MFRWSQKASGFALHPLGHFIAGHAGPLIGSGLAVAGYDAGHNGWYQLATAPGLPYVLRVLGTLCTQQALRKCPASHKQFRQSLIDVVVVHYEIAV